jgi:predicted metal-binding protein
MKNNVVSPTSERIISIIKEHESKSKQRNILVRLKNVGGCKGSEMKLQLHMLYDEKQFSQIVSDCLSLDEVRKIRKIVENFCKESNGTYTMKE